MNDNAIAMGINEILAQWHIIVEHQLSFIYEFEIYKNSLNIQKLG